MDRMEDGVCEETSAPDLYVYKKEPPPKRISGAEDKPVWDCEPENYL